ncbi:MAG: rod shape-determining protein MreC [Clostridia bacterium]|jgi:rod shape-determining protein MreC|nr:rod shape-determining protein MreC [Clostridia bacterium]
MKHSKILQFLLPPLICALLCAGIPSVLILTGHGEPIRTAVNTILSPIRGVFSDAGDGIRDISAYITEFDALKAENERLRSQLASMEDTIRAAELTLEENAFLREFLSLKESHNDYRFLKCEIVASDASAGYRRTLTLNAGTVEGAAVGYPVITPSGVVGRITEVGGNWAKAAPITELSSAIGAYVERSGDSGVAEGSYLYRDAGQLLFNYLEEDADIIIGDRIRTSGVNSYYPRGLLIGEITEILTDPATGARSAVITPTSPLSDLRDVMVLTDFAIYETEPGQIPSDGTETESITDTP